jgi:hypothetical protein
MWVWFRILLLLISIIVWVFHINTHNYNKTHKNTIISSQYKDVRPFWIMRFLILLIFLFMFFCYKPIDLPDIKYVNSIKIETENSTVKESLWVSVCKAKEILSWYTCNEIDEKYWCEEEEFCKNGICFEEVCWIYDSIIDSGSTIPAYWTTEIHTLKEGQTEMHFEIYQGENFIAGKNKLLKDWILITWLPKKDSWEAWVTVTLKINKLWHLSFSAVDIDNQNNKTELVVKIPNDDYDESFTWKVSAFEVLKWKLKEYF